MNQRVLYLDCFSGISGDMTVGALLDLGADAKELTGALAKLPIGGYRVEVSRGQKKGIGGTDFRVLVENPENQPLRHLQDILEIIETSPLSRRVKENSSAIFGLIAEAEAKVHGMPKEKVHFHEVGAVDSLMDIIGTAVCLELLGTEQVWSSPLNLGSGFVQCAHGTLPVPAPATLNILTGVPVYSSGVQQELTTPTGAAIVKTLCEQFSDFPLMEIEKVGYGLGKRELETPNLLRAVLGKVQERSALSVLTVLETNIDNMSPEIYSYLFPQLFARGALDVYITPIIMKKNRPGQMLSVLCPQETIGAIQDILFKETTTLGIRKYKVQREELQRSIEKIKSPYGDVAVKAAYINGRLLKLSPEYEECARIASQHKLPLPRVYADLTALAWQILNQDPR